MSSLPTIDLGLAIGSSRLISRHIAGLVKKYGLARGEEGIQQALRQAVVDTCLAVSREEVTEAHMWAYLIHLDR
jgi:hypothetical protein